MSFMSPAGKSEALLGLQTDKHNQITHCPAMPVPAHDNNNNNNNFHLILRLTEHSMITSIV